MCPFSRTRSPLCAPNVKVMSLPFLKEKEAEADPEMLEKVRKGAKLSLLRQAEHQPHKLMFVPSTTASQTDICATPGGLWHLFFQ